ncbi:SpoIIE family protein phosphatase [Chloroflexota bacterium]
MNCPHCQTKNPSEARFCFNCGQPLVRRCSSCETELPSGARFCMHCGQPVLVTTPVDETRLTRLAAAAPNPPFLLSAQQDIEVEKLTRTGVPLGIVAETNWEQRTLQLSSGAVLVFYTDGVTDAQDKQAVFFGEERLVASAQLNRNEGAQNIQDAIWAEIQDFVGGVPQFDDITLIVLVRDFD